MTCALCSVCSSPRVPTTRGELCPLCLPLVVPAPHPHTLARHLELGERYDLPTLALEALTLGETS